MGVDVDVSNLSGAFRKRQLVTIATGAEYVNVHPRTLRRWIAAGRVPAYRLGPRLIKVDLVDLEEYLRPVTCTQLGRRSN